MESIFETNGLDLVGCQSYSGSRKLYVSIGSSLSFIISKNLSSEASVRKGEEETIFNDLSEVINGKASRSKASLKGGEF
jgi:hypothetical protein